MKKQIPYAVANYEELIENNYFFIDKTEYIQEIEGYKIPVFLRPRRFGKSLWCSMLSCYYDIDRASKFDMLFGQFEIGKNPTPNRSKYMVLNFDFSKVSASHGLEHIEKSFHDRCRNAFEVFIARYKNTISPSRRIFKATRLPRCRISCRHATAATLLPST